MPCGSKIDETDEVTTDHKYIAKAYSISLVNWWHVSKVYIPRIALGVLAAATAALWQPVLAPLWAEAATLQTVQDVLTQPWTWSVVVVVLLSVYVLLPARKAPVYLMDFAVFKPPSDWACSHDDLIEICRRNETFSEESLSFMRRVLDRSQTGHATHWPPGTFKLIRGDGTADRTMEAAREESRAVIFSCVDEALERTGLKPTDIDILIVNCSLFVPTPSLAGMVHSHYKMRPDTRTYNLGGMGCSASVIGVDLARQLLEASPGCRALVVSTENLTQQLYLGKEKSMLVQNMLFRCGGAAVVLSSRATDFFSAKYKLLLTHRTQTSGPAALECVWQCEDAEGNRGIRLSKDVPAIAGKALKHNLTAIAPYVLPLREQFAVLLREAMRWTQTHLVTLGSAVGAKWLSSLQRPRPYIPDFKKGIDHFCIHAGGRAVIDGVGQNLKLSKADTAASRGCLYHFGNTSSSSIWYELRFCEQEDESWIAEDAGRPVRSGDRILQMAFGSGFMCNSAVWLRIR